MNQSIKQAAEQRREEVVLDLRDLFYFLIKGSWLILILGLVGAFMGVMVVHDSEPIYKARIYLTPSDGGDRGGLKLSTHMATLTGISSASGVTESGGASLLGRMEYLFSSQVLAEVMQEKYKLLQIVFKDRWDGENQKWKRPTGSKFERQEAINKFLNQHTWIEPNIALLAKYLSGAVILKKPAFVPFYQIVVEHTDPDYALFLLKAVYKEADQILRDQDRKNVKVRQDYLEERFATAQLVEVRRMFLGMLGEEVRRGMLLESDLPYAGRIIEEASVSARPIPPNVNIEVGARAIVGMSLGILLVCIYFFFRKKPQ